MQLLLEHLQWHSVWNPCILLYSGTSIVQLGIFATAVVGIVYLGLDTTLKWFMNLPSKNNVIY